MSPLSAQTSAELRMTLRRGESVLLSLGIPTLLLVFFSLVDVLPMPLGAGQRRVAFLAPGILALAIMSSAMVGIAIATAFERQYGVLKRIGTTPLGRKRLLAAKITATVLVEVLQMLVLTAVGVALGWRPSAGGLGICLGALVLGTAAFAGLGLLMAGTMRAEAVLAGANGLYMVLLLLSGMIFSASRLPKAMQTVAKLFPSTALTNVIRGAFDSHLVATGDVHIGWIVLAIWAVGAPLVAARLFRWE